MAASTVISEPVETVNLFASIPDAIQAYGRGEMLIVVDDEDRENEGDLVVAADHISDQAINFMITHARGLVCMPITADRAAELNLPPMVDQNEDHHGTAFTRSIDGAPKHGITTGISTADRAKTIRLALDGNSDDLCRPGHIFPLIARDGGIVERQGHTEAAVEFAKLAGLRPAGVIVEIIGDDGTMLRRDGLFDFARKHGLLIVTIDALKEHVLALTPAGNPDIISH